MKTTGGSQLGGLLGDKYVGVVKIRTKDVPVEGLKTVRGEWG